ncbi:hypothetical protein IID24_04745 [Patescibacteria group bacterium]|nr:hypothetical protein [Patescibacteria group bacterium]
MVTKEEKEAKKEEREAKKAEKAVEKKAKDDKKADNIIANAKETVFATPHPASPEEILALQKQIKARNSLDKKRVPFAKIPVGTVLVKASDKEIKKFQSDGVLIGTIPGLALIQK